MKRWRSRKAVTQTDWAVSIAIFMFYLFWFFAFIRPLAVRAVPIDPLISIAEDGFIEDASFSIERVPILLPQDTDREFEPMIVPLPYDWNTSNMLIPDIPFVLDNGRLLFLADTRNTSVFPLLHTDTTYEQPETLLYLISTASQARVFNFVAGFEESVLDHMVYGLGLILQDANVSVDGVIYEPSLGSFTDLGTIAKYRATGDKIDQDTYVFARNSRVYAFVETTDFATHNFTIHAQLKNFTFYSAGQVDGVSIDYDSSVCSQVIADKIDFDDGSRGLAFFFDDEATVTFCPDGSHLLFSASFTFENASAYSIFAHDGGAEAVAAYPAAPILGFIETLEGISIDNMITLQFYSYDELKKRWRFPAAREFSVSVSSTPLNTTFGQDRPSTVNVYAREKRAALLEDDGQWTPARINVRVW